MAVVHAILQPVVAGDLHAAALRELLRCGWATDFVLSSAYVNSPGVGSVEREISAVGATCQVFVGVRNGSTTGQGLAALLRTGASVYAVDTATRSRIFHAKVYIARSADRAVVIIGSANLTHAGLFNNIEAGARIELDLTDPSDRDFLQKIEGNLRDLPVNFPDNCYPVTTRRQIIEMIRDGRLEDERDQRVGTAVGVARGGGAGGARSRLLLPYVTPPRRRSRRQRLPGGAPGAPPAPIGTAPHFGPIRWEKPNLHRTDLQLLRRGHDPGVLRLTQARFEVGGPRIDWRTYFRHDLFASLTWTVDPNDPGKEMATAKFSLVVQGVYVGDYDLKLSHKPAWEAGQGNYTTGVHWGDATPEIRRDALIGHTLKLYEPTVSGNPYIIEID